MPSASRYVPLPWGTALFALFGAGYCALQSGYFGESFCPGSGCLLFQAVSVAGVSLWWIGVAAFILIALCCLWRRPDLAFFLVSAGLAADSLLLVVMLGIASCLSCLGAALFLGLLFLLLRRAPQRWARSQTKPSILFMIWFVLFLSNGVAALNEHFKAWVLTGAEHSERRVYFSPSCPACKDAVAAFAGNAAFVPVMKDEADFAAIVQLEQGLRDGLTLPEAFAASLSENNQNISLGRSLLMRLRLMRNKADILRLGFDAVPLLLINGLPQSLRDGESVSPHPAAQPVPDPSFSLSPAMENLDQCTQDTALCSPPR